MSEQFGPEGLWKDELTAFFQEGIRTKSYSDEEGTYAALILKEMQRLGYDEVTIDPSGNVVGRIGTGPLVIHIDSHMDTVQALDSDEWIVPPFSGTIIENVIYGRGAVDMKGGLSSSVYAAVLARDAGYLEGKTLYVTASVCEEYCDGVCLEHFYKDSGLRPDFCIICEPSSNRIAIGHNGKMQARIRTHGISAHGSAPDLGINAVYEMSEIIDRVENLNTRLKKTDEGGTVVLSNISCVTASLNAVPSECEIYLDRRLHLGETIDQVCDEFDELIEGKRASWEIGTLHHTSWTGTELVYKPSHNPWIIATEHPLTKAANRAYIKTFTDNPEPYNFWDFNTNAGVPVSMGIPTIGFGPGDAKLAHMRDECCPIDQVLDAALFYSELFNQLGQ